MYYCYLPLYSQFNMIGHSKTILINNREEPISCTIPTYRQQTTPDRQIKTSPSLLSLSPLSTAYIVLSGHPTLSLFYNRNPYYLSLSLSWVLYPSLRSCEVVSGIHNPFLPPRWNPQRRRQYSPDRPSSSISKLGSNSSSRTCTCIAQCVR